MHFSPLFQFFAGLGSGLGGGFLAGLFGVGGGIVLIPLLGFFLGLNQHQAQGVTLVALLLPYGLPAAIHFHSRGIPIHWRLVAMMMMGFLPAGWVGAALANHIPEGPLRWGFIGFILVLSAKTYYQKTQIQNDSTEETSIPNRWPWRGLLIGCLGGLTAGLLGIGGAVIMIPLMTIWLRLPQHQAQLASMVLLIPPIGLPAVLEYAKHQLFPWIVIGGLAIGFLGGAYVGARIATRIAGLRLKRIFAGVMVLMAILLAIR